MVKQAIEQSRCDDGIAEEFAPFCEAAVGGEDHGALFIAGIRALVRTILKLIETLFNGIEPASERHAVANRRTAGRESERTRWLRPTRSNSPGNRRSRSERSIAGRNSMNLMGILGSRCSDQNYFINFLPSFRIQV